ncbi:FtsX-like permease family protein [Aneurinibacillus migulanus]|uniref:ABC transporter permease n=1 Tax=Aneurinibacillus migulanus TaxID=47500 RepID=A0A0D1VCK8_ANEMI|nr:FtsX-like permease family protein [Aneurinibacillus migulanus]KIV57169.1 ABC transporter permease [Aneurinibacillus migulanus]KON96938.1 ABC transporter permease [Aneurinibacillus migulanus]MED0894307.1 FtsX-like permease family protein [Aneurinibacillus migulanus]MED1619580.1 FtsX-like permease family protein [Aneurinibacillus migulanus]SDJ68141.1 putative ABC transport system permease protein [Aneurinibacillus migulanus]
MNSFKIAYKLLKNNLNIYGLYLIVLVVTVATYYNFISIQYNDTFVQLTKRLQSAVIPSMTCGFVLICTVAFFMWHANGFFFKQRQKETGLYMLMGISSSKIGRVFAIESMLLGGLSLLIGLSIGILFSKFFFILLGKVMYLEVELPFTVAPKAILQLVIVFGTLFVVLGFKNYNVVKRSQLINMIHAAKAKPSIPKLNYKKGILGILLIAVGYMIASNFKRWDWDLMTTSMITLVLVSFGTYFFFGSFLTIIFSKLTKSKNMIYKDVRLVSISNIFFRLKANYRSLAMTAILAAATVTACSISLSFKQYAEDHEMIEAPYSLSYESNDKNTKDKVRVTIAESAHELIGVNEVNFFIGNIEYVSKVKKVDYNNEAIITSYSQIQKTLEFLKYKNRKSILKQIKPRENEITFILNANTMAAPINVKGDKIRLDRNTYYIKENIQVPFTGNVAKFGKKNIYVLHDREYEKLKTNVSEITLNGIQITGQEDSEKLVKNIAKIVPDGLAKVSGYVKQYIWEYYALEIFFFLGLIMSIVFMLATFSTIYFKILSDALMDREQYIMLKKIGMSKKEIQKSIYLQIGVAFLFPVILGIIHSVVAINMLEEIMNVSFVLQMMYGIGLFVSIMIVFYVKISKNYTKLVYEE